MCKNVEYFCSVLVWHYSYLYAAVGFCICFMESSPNNKKKDKSEKKERRNNMWQIHNSHINMQLTLCLLLSKSYFMLVYKTAASLFSKWWKQLDMSNYVFIQKQERNMKRVVHNLWKLKAPELPFCCHFHLRTVLSFIDFLFFLQAFSHQQWYSTYFDKLSQFIASLKTSNWYGLSELQGFLMQRENVICLMLSIIVTVNHILLCQTLTWALFQTLQS